MGEIRRAILLLCLSLVCAESVVPVPTYEQAFMEGERYNLTLPKLPYNYSALEPHIDEATMKVHHLGHHASYTAKLNQVLNDWRESVRCWGGKDCKCYFIECDGSIGRLETMDHC